MSGLLIEVSSFKGNKLISGSIEDIGDDSVFSLIDDKRVTHQEKIAAADFGEAARQILTWLDASRSVLPKIQELGAVGHRVVHGGDRFTASARIDDEVIEGIEEMEELAPLHNIRSVRVIRAAQAMVGADMPMVAVFDTAFHRTIPVHARTYSLPLGLARRHRIHRYGFHGISHEYLAGRYAQITDKPVRKREADHPAFGKRLLGLCRPQR